MTKLSNKFILTAVITLVLVSRSFSQAPPQYTARDLGTLGGGENSAYGINESGQVVGYSTLSGDLRRHAYLYSGGTMRDLGTLASLHSYAYAINKAGQVVGMSYNNYSQLRAVVYGGGGITDLGTLGGGQSAAYGINNSGQIVGWSETSGGTNSHAFLYSAGTMVDLGTFGGTGSQAYAINDFGQVVGGSNTTGDSARHAFLYSGGVMKDLGTFGGNDSLAEGINNSGQIVGSSTFSTGTALHAFSYSAGVMTDLGTLGGSTSVARSINKSGQIVGYSYLSGDPVYHATIYSGGKMYDLNTLLTTTTNRPELIDAHSINDSGQIAVTGYATTGQLHGFLLSPVNLVPAQHLETESMGLQALSGASHSIISDVNLSGGAGTQLNATGTGQYVTYTVPVSTAGTYQVKVGVKSGAKRGIFRLSIGGVTQGTAQDEYTSTIGYGVRNLGTRTFSSGGNKAFKFLVSGKNTNSGGYSIGLDYIELIPTTASSRSETESLTVQAISPVPSGYSSAQWFGVFNASAASGGAGTYFNAIAQGNYITYTVPVAKAGTYHVRVGIQTKPNKGKFQLAINGVNQGQVQDEYNPSVTYNERDLGTVYLNSGDQALKFKVTGKNASSTGYTLAFDYIELVP